jgi:CubicO group peptidase (beta-lactamase class C family)
MQSGVPDFDNDVSRHYQFDHPEQDLGPVEEMSFLWPMKKFAFRPGTGTSYSSSNYELLGLILAQQANKTSWEEYTQAQDLPVLPEMKSTSFATRGKCSKYMQVHGYSSNGTNDVDVYDVSCTNGWTCGNLLSSAGDAAIFARALLGNEERVVKKSTREEMVKFHPFDAEKAWSAGIHYGLGVMDFSARYGKPLGTLIGHGGETYGFISYTIYAVGYDFAISIVANGETPLVTNITQGVLSAAFATIVQYLSTGTTTPSNSTPSTIIV